MTDRSLTSKEQAPLNPYQAMEDGERYRQLLLKDAEIERLQRGNDQLTQNWWAMQRRMTEVLADRDRLREMNQAALERAAAEIERLRPMAESWQSYEAAQARKAEMGLTDETKTSELLDIAREVSTMDCFYTGATHEAGCQCIVGRAERAIAPSAQEARKTSPKYQVPQLTDKQLQKFASEHMSHGLVYVVYEIAHDANLLVGYEPDGDAPIDPKDAETLGWIRLTHAVQTDGG